MSDLEFVAFSDDGKMIILQGPDGNWVEVPIRESQKTYTTPVEIENGENISPREIQSRIRAGASPAELAAATGNSLERIMSYAPPIMLERAHVATKATRTVIRRASGSGPLGDTVSAKLERLGIDASELEWDSFRREDGRWTVSVSFNSETGLRKANWLFDVRNNALVAADEDARWLIGDPVRIQEDLEKENQKPTESVEFLAPVTNLHNLRSEPVALAVDEATQNSHVQIEDPAIDELLLEIKPEPASELIIAVPEEFSSETADDLMLDEMEESIRETVEADSETSSNSSDTSEIRPPKIPSWDEILFGPSGD